MGNFMRNPEVANNQKGTLYGKVLHTSQHALKWINCDNFNHF